MARPRKPTHLKVVTGTLEKPVVNPYEPRPDRGIPPSPPGMTAGAKRAWKRLAPMLDKMGVLTVADSTSLGQLCELIALIGQAQASLNALGSLTYEAVSAGGATLRRPHPEVAIIADADRRLRTYLNDFGLSPAARSKVTAVDNGAAADPLESYFG